MQPVRPSELGPRIESITNKTVSDAGTTGQIFCSLKIVANKQFGRRKKCSIDYLIYSPLWIAALAKMLPHASYLLRASATKCCANGSLHVQPGETMFNACVLPASPSILQIINVPTHTSHVTRHLKSITSCPLCLSMS